MLKFIDLFCGIGGFHIVMKKLNYECIMACDIDKYCREIYDLNFQMKPQSDIKNIKEIDDFDILCAGFPCQPFSNSGKKKTFKDKRGLLFDEIIRIAKDKKPLFMFLENVKHILKIDNGKVLEYILNELQKIGYNTQIFLISPHNYGIPQHRQRVYFVCVRNDIYNNKNIELIIEKNNYKLNDFLEKNVNDKYYLNNELKNVLEKWDEMIHTFEIGEKISPTILIHDVYKNYTENEFEKLAEWRKDYMTKNKRLFDKYKNQFDIWYKQNKELLKKSEIYGKLEWQVGEIKKNDSIFNYFIQIRQSGIRVKKPNYFPTLVAISQIPIYGPEKRFITPRECARLQSFPDDFILHSDDKITYKQLGNSINIDNAYTIIFSTLKHYNFIK
jgi:DNA (cytosine-5)-methyltransferase 1